MQLEKSIKIIKALGDNSRLLIVNSLREKPQYVEELAERLDLADSTVSFHLKKLAAAGLVNKVKEQYYVIFHLNDQIFNTTLTELTSIKNNSKAVQDDRLRKYRDNVIKTFRKKGKIEKLPAQYKKRVLLYEDILSSFIPGKLYQEEEIDSMISQVYDDYCTIRRAFIDEKMMTRKNGEYCINKDYVFQFPSAPQYKNRLKIKMNKVEIKKSYKIEGPPMGVYLITNIATGTKYLGNAKNLNGIINRHKFELSTGMHQIKDLQDSWNNSGESSIIFEIIDKLERKEDPGYNYNDDLKVLENLWFEKLSSEGIQVINLRNTRI